MYNKKCNFITSDSYLIFENITVTTPENRNTDMLQFFVTPESNNFLAGSRILVSKGWSDTGNHWRSV